MREHMIVFPFSTGGYAVRPATWGGIFDKDGKLKSSCNVTAVFMEEADAMTFCRMRNDPMAFAAAQIKGELLENKEIREAFLVCIEDSLKENNLPFAPEREISERVLERLMELPEEGGKKA